MDTCHCYKKFYLLHTFPRTPVHGCGEGMAKQLSSWLEGCVVKTVDAMVIKPNTVTFVKMKHKVFQVYLLEFTI